MYLPVKIPMKLPGVIYILKTHLKNPIPERFTDLMMIKQGITLTGFYIAAS